ncbi:P-type conjugative transfer protein TrbG [Novosphingobium terrae]|uniref:P-type conjugative transfer protein TrbG n=1 Tax=Novosphingobium terrae TaxID=2726189 RepID=UPI001F12F4CA|nr:P-type conjugative transfer protein TrbG [Novosphingobium terrae]
MKTLASLAAFAAMTIAPAAMAQNAGDDASLAKQYYGKNPTLTPVERSAVEISNEWMTKSATGMRPFAGDGGAVVFQFGATEPTVVCAVLQVCDIELQAGEQVNSVNVGDSARWLIEPAISQSGAAEIQHLVVKPMDVGLHTSLMVATDRRTYHIQLVSHATQYMPRVGFQYPDEAAAKWAALRQRQEKVRSENTLPSAASTPTGVEGESGPSARGAQGSYLGSLNFDYTVKGQARWKPVRVYNDGVKTIIEMPSTMSQTEAPSLLVLRQGGSVKREGDVTLVNYRVQNGRYIVDQVFDEAVLVAGVGKLQERVTITRGKP